MADPIYMPPIEACDDCWKFLQEAKALDARTDSLEEDMAKGPVINIVKDGTVYRATRIDGTTFTFPAVGGGGSVVYSLETHDRTVSKTFTLGPGEHDTFFFDQDTGPVSGLRVGLIGFNTDNPNITPIRIDSLQSCYLFNQSDSSTVTATVSVTYRYLQLVAS